jgi:CHAT domain-containing protein/tetratricopeptide (TPR) repeat protein
LALALLLAACHHRGPVAEVLASQCLAVGAGQEAVLSVTPQAAGTLRVTVDERGITTLAELDEDAGTLAASPLDRMGTIVLTASTARGTTHSVWVRALDAPTIRGTACIAAEVIPDTDHALVQAANDLATAGRATVRKDWNTAFSRYLQAARRLDASGPPQAAASARQALAELAYRRFDRKRDAYALAGEALAEYSASTDPALAGLLAALQAKALMDMPGMGLHQTLPAVRERLAAARRLVAASGSSARELPRLDILDGFLDYRTDRREEAHAWWTLAAQRCRELADWDCYGIAVQNNAQLAKENKSYASALATFEEALRLLPPALDPKLVADIWNNLGVLQGEVGLFSSSGRSYAAAMRAYIQLGDCQGVRRTLSSSGSLLVQVGSLADAESSLAQAATLDCPSLLATGSQGPLTSLPEVTTPAPAGGSREPLGPCAHPLDAESLNTENKNIIFNSLLSLGEARMLQGEPEEAEPCLAAAQRYATTSRTRMRLANARGNTLLERGEARSAQAAFSLAQQIADEARLPPTYEHRGLAQLGLVKSELLAGHSVDALRHADLALESSIARGDIDQTVASLRLIAAALRASAEPNQAREILGVAADLIEAVPIDELDGEQRATYLATQHAVFAELTDLIASECGNDRKLAWEAFASSERGRARSLRLATSQTTHDSSQPSLSTTRYRELLHEVVSLPARNDHRTRAGLLAEIDRAARAQRDPPDTLSPEELSDTLRQLGATLVEYAVGSRDLFAFVVSPDSTSVIRVGNAHDVAAAAASLRERARETEASPREVQAAAAALARLILWPLAEHISTSRVIFVPDDALHTIPFVLLPWSATGSELLVQHVESVIVPSASFLTRMHRTPQPPVATPRIELIGDPVFRVADWARECNGLLTETPVTQTHASRTLVDWTESLPRLPGSRAEIAMIAKLAHESRPDSRIETLAGCAAVPDALRRAAGSDVQLLHIATHARIDAQRPRLSALALSPERGSNATVSTFGLLDILGLKLRSRLVVLSACDTSRGRLLDGEGVLGPAQAFLQAGANSVMASYWRVDDQRTSAFMQQFYRHLLLEHLPASAALRRTQLAEAHAATSFDWAAFALYGWSDSTL